MEMPYVLVALIINLILSHVIANNVGRTRKIGYRTTFLVCFFLSAIIGLLIAISSDKAETHEEFQERMKLEKEAKLNNRRRFKSEEFNSTIKSNIELLKLNPLEIKSILDQLKNIAWHVFNDNPSSDRDLIFQENGILLVSNNGNIKKNKWEYVEVKNGLLIDIGVKQIIYDIVWNYNGRLALKSQSKTKPSYLLLYKDSMDFNGKVKEFFNNFNY